MTMGESNIVREFKMICKEYECDDSIFNEDDEKINILKDIINRRLETEIVPLRATEIGALLKTPST